jgi:alpha-glucan,water dikinase
VRQEVLAATSEPSIVIINKISGDEDIPSGITGVITETELDVLAHISVRARNGQLYLATCADPDEISRLITEFEGRLVSVQGLG